MSSVYNDLGEGVEREGGKLRNCLRGIICLYAGGDPTRGRGAGVAGGVPGTFAFCSRFVRLSSFCRALPLVC